ncbi:hypothetical protein [Anatilimnocola floriformis]|uniref:hypothetical protein n=1 Tax=Anatilimnocola floriformis TaxID=2948575 RepID=UPI0020C1BF43|nr:hypothetical protein [Anatilimnocola floriformis]
MRPLHKVLYFIPMVFGWLVSFAALTFLAIVFADGRGRDREVIPFLIFPAMLPAMIGVGLPMMILMYKAWNSIQDGSPRTTPGVAVLLLFVPLFNLYWMFQAWWGWAQDFNRYARQRNLTVHRAPEGLALTYCILLLLSSIPVLGLPFAMVNQVVLLILAYCCINSINSLIAARSTTVEAEVV